jgi:hypothetical protein
VPIEAKILGCVSARGNLLWPYPLGTGFL